MDLDRSTMMSGAPGQIQYEGLHCGLSIKRPGGGVVIVRLSGWDAGELGDVPMRELAKDLAEHDQIELFIDARHSKGASIEVSAEWARWLGEHRSQFKHISMLTGSQFIQLTANFVRRFSGLRETMRIYTNPTAFDAALAQAVLDSA